MHACMRARGRSIGRARAHVRLNFACIYSIEPAHMPLDPTVYAPFFCTQATTEMLGHLRAQLDQQQRQVDQLGLGWISLVGLGELG